jgi:hypothetical protein
VLGLAVTAATPAQAASGCSVTAYTPTYSSPYVYGAGLVSCSSVASDESLYIEMDLTMDGSSAAWDATRCWGRQCDVTTTATNRSGNQSWCSSVRVWAIRDSGSQTFIGSDTACEGSAWLA